MDIDEAREILKALANGVNPATGEILPNSSPYNNPKIIRAIFTILETSAADKKAKKPSRESKQRI